MLINPIFWCMGIYLGTFSEASDRFECQELGSVVIATKRNQMFRLVGSFVTKPRTKTFSFRKFQTNERVFI